MHFTCLSLIINTCTVIIDMSDMVIKEILMLGKTGKHGCTYTDIQTYISVFVCVFDYYNEFNNYNESHLLQILPRVTQQGSHLITAL